MVGRVAGITVYPVKSCAGILVERAEVSHLGLEYDRRWAVVDRAGTVLTARDHPGLLAVRPSLADDTLQLAIPGGSPVVVPLAGAGGVRRQAEVWGDRVTAEDAGDDAAVALASHLGTAVRLVRLPKAAARAVEPAIAGPGHRVGFADAYPLLIVGTASLAELGRRLGHPISAARFRPNLLVETSVPFAEDDWDRIAVGEVRLAVVKPCARCKIVTLDPDTGEGGPEPLRTLAGFRRRGTDVLFGQNALVLATGEVEIGAPVEIPAA